MLQVEASLQDNIKTVFKKLTCRLKGTSLLRSLKLKILDLILKKKSTQVLQVMEFSRGLQRKLVDFLRCSVLKSTFKWTVARDFLSRFFSQIYALGPDFEAEKIFFSLSFSRCYSNISMNPRCRLCIAYCAFVIPRCSLQRLCMI